MNNFGVNTWIQ